MAVLLAFALMFAPAADAAVCSDDAPVASAQQVAGDVLGTSVDAAVTSQLHGDAAEDFGDSVAHCQHGHCHHAGSFLPGLVAEVADYPLASTPHAKLQNQHPRSRAASRLERPPRV